MSNDETAPAWPAPGARLSIAGIRDAAKPVKTTDGKDGPQVIVLLADLPVVLSNGRVPPAIPAGTIVRLRFEPARAWLQAKGGRLASKADISIGGRVLDLTANPET